MLIFFLSLIDDEYQRIKFEEIYTTYRLQMIYLAKSILKSESDAEDVVHEVFFRIASKHMKILQQINNSEDMRNYLLKATKNTALNELKKRRNRYTSIEDIPESELDSIPNFNDNSFVDLICMKAEYDTVVQALLSMDEPYRDIMYYHFVMNFSVSESAELLSRNLATAKKQLVRGKKILLYKLNISEEHKDGNDKK